MEGFSLENIFIDVQSKLTEPVKWSKFKRARDTLVMLE